MNDERQEGGPAPDVPTKTGPATSLTAGRQGKDKKPGTDEIKSIADSAIEYWRAGIAPVVLSGRGNTKQPVGKGWPDFVFKDEKEVRRAFARGNVGIRLGDGLADVDLDDRWAIAVADSLLPATGAEFGRSSAPRSHRLYRIRGGGDLTYRKHVGAGRESLVELRADGGKQTMAPPSTHPSGEPVRWACAGRVADAAEVDGDVLASRVAAVGLASLLARYWPGEGARNDASLALAGALLRGAQDDAGLIEMAEEIVTAVATASGDEEAADRAGQTVPGTCRALADGRNVTGWTKLGELLVADDSAKVVAAARTISSHLREALRVPPERRGDADDFSDPEAAERGLDGSERTRHLVVQRASEIKVRRVLWLWEGRMALGTLSLLAGREGLGKSSLIAWLIAQLSRGTLPGDLYGQPRAVIIAATEDSWEHTLVPRLMAAGADLHLVLRVDVMTSKGFTVDVSLPEDIPAVKELAQQENVALMVLDPLMSRLHNLDTHKDAEVRIALEPLVRMADEVGMSLIGLIHLNKSSTDPLNAVMGSKAFTAVARSVSTVVPDDSDEDDRRRLFGTVKNNLGPALPASQVYTIETAQVETEDGPMPVGKLVWHGEVDTTIKAAMADTGMDSRTAVHEAREWLFDFLTDGAAVARKDVITAAKREGFSESAMKRAARDLHVVSTSSGFPRTAHWSLPEPFETDETAEDS